MIKRYPRDRGGARDRKRPGGAVPPVERRVDSHPLYGDIPLKVHAWWRHDPNYAPRLPRGAVRGDVRKQQYCTAHDVPKYFYVDEERRCVQCGADFVFEAAEQKYWYETLAFNFGSIPIRCAPCRRRRRTEHALREQIGAARAAVRADGKDPGARLSLARALVEYHERTGQGDLDEAVAEARKATGGLPDSSEPVFWEGVAQIRAGRAARGRALLRSFLERKDPSRGRLAARAEAYL
jgi:hypothetical protein